MTQTASIDLAALAAPRRDFPAGHAARKGQADFMQSMQQAEDRAQPEAPKAEPHDKIDRPKDKPDTPETSRKDDPAPEADRQQESAAKPQADKPASEKAPEAEKPKAEQAEAPKVPVADKPAEEAPAPQTPEEAQAALALALATGVQLVQKAQAATVQAETATELAEAGTPVETATEAKGQTAQAPAGKLPELELPEQASKAAEAALAAAKAQQAVTAQGQAQAAEKSQAPAHSQATQHANENAKLPAFLAQAAQGLGKVTVETKTETAPQLQTTTGPVREEGFANLAMQMLDEQPQEITTGSTTQMTLLDDVTDIETTSQAVNLLEGETEPGADEAEGPDGFALLNGDRTAPTDAKGGQGIKPAALPLKPEDVMPQILKHAEQVRAAQQNSVKLQLYPENLGKMEIKVTSHQGVISAQLTAENQQVKSMLETQVAHLQRSFAEMGLKVDKVEVAIASSNLNFDAQGSMAQGQEQGTFSQQQQRPATAQVAYQGSGYEQWLGDEPAEEHYADLAGSTAINYVA